MLKHIIIQNLCQHRNLSLQLGPGLTGVIGHQGSGKTNMCTLALSALSGTNPLPGNKEDNITYGCKDQPAFVAVTYQAGNREFTVTRGYNKRKSSIVIDGEIRDEIRREGEITAAVSQLTGVDAANVFRFSFVAQSATDAMFQQKETDRVKFAAELLGLVDVLDWGARINQAYSKIEGILVTDYKQALQVSLADRSIKWSKILQQRSNVQTLTAEQCMLEAQYEATLQRRQQYLELQKRRTTLSELVAKLTQLKSKHAIDKKRVADLNASIITTGAEITRRESLDQFAKVAETEKQVLKEVNDYTRRIQELREALVQPSQPAKMRPPGEELDRLTAEIPVHRRNVQLAKSGKSVCDTCGSAIAVAGVDTKALQEKLDGVERLQKEYAAVEKSWQVYDTTLALWKQNKASNEDSLTRGLALLEEKRASLDAIALAKEKLPQNYERWTDFQWTSIRTSMSTSDKEVAATNVRIESDALTIVELEVQVAEATELVNQANLSEQEIAEFSRLESRLGQVKIQLDNEKLSLNTIEVEYQRLMGSIENTVKCYQMQRKTVQARDLIASVAPMLKATGIPQEILFNRMLAATRHITHLCAELGQPFKIEVDDSLRFIATWPSGHVEPVTRLSQGQRACAATMFWIARLLSNQNGLPIMVLDEPSANMDADVVHQFGLMLVRLNQILIQRNLQVILITHHQQLASCCNSVCRL